MRFEYTNPSRKRVRGKPFKLFSDELPQIELNKTYLDEYQNESKEREKNGRYDRRNETDFINHDRFSLPSIGTPEWDRMSGSDRGRSKSQSPDHMLSPNLVRINQRIRRKYGITDRREQFFQQLNNSPMPQKTSPNNRDGSMGNLKLTETKSKLTEYGNTDESSVSTETKPKSILQQLLNASAKEAAKNKEIEEGLKLSKLYHENNYRRNTVRRQPTLHKKMDVKERKEDTETIKLEHTENGFDRIEPIKSGILKRTVGRSLSTKLSIKECLIKPRLIHQENVTANTSYKSEHSHDDVKISVYVDTPLSRLNDLLYVPSPPNTPKERSKRRVNFIERDISDDTGVSVQSRLTSLDEKSKEEFKTTAVHVRSSAGLDGTEAATITFERTDNTAKTVKDTATVEKVRSVAQKKNRNKKKSTRDDLLIRTTATEKYSGFDEDKQDLIDTILLTAQRKEYLKDQRIHPVWKAVKSQQPDLTCNHTEITQVPDVTTSIKSTPPASGIKSTPSASGIQSTPPASGKHSSISRGRNLRGGFIPSINIPFDPLDSITSESYIDSPGFDALSEMDMDMFGEFDFDDFAEHIDRSLSGEELIKAYRFWDRKRKAFPNGLRKIDAPPERGNFNTYPTQYGNVKTYKMTGQKQEVQTSLNDNKKTRNGFIIDSF